MFGIAFLLLAVVAFGVVLTLGLAVGLIKLLFKLAVVPILGLAMLVILLAASPAILVVMAVLAVPAALVAAAVGGLKLLAAL